MSQKNKPYNFVYFAFIPHYYLSIYPTLDLGIIAVLKYTNASHLTFFTLIVYLPIIIAHTVSILLSAAFVCATIDHEVDHHHQR